MSNKFCRFLSNSMSIQLEKGKLIARPCCWSNDQIQFDQNHNEKRQAVFDSIDGWTSGCDICHQQESAGNRSFRHSSFDIIPELENNAIASLDINIDMTCNAACVMCDPTFSTTWAIQTKKFNIRNGSIPESYDYQQQLDFILSTVDLSELRRVKFFGGEPLLTDSHLQVLRKIPHPEQCDIWYTTNGSVLPDNEVLQLWSKFKLVFMEVSIDGVGEQFEYIRWPLPWTKLERNLLKLKETAPVNVMFRINHTLNPFNIFYYDRLDYWITNNLSTNRLGDATEINIHPCWGTWSLSKTPLGLRELIFEKYNNHSVSELLKQVAVDDPRPILDFTNKWETVRNNNWKLVFPDIVKFFD